MYHISPNEIISSLVTPLMDTSKRAREYIVEISLNDAPVPVVRRLSVPSNLYVGHFVYELVYAMGWDGYHLTELTQGDTLWRSTKEKAMDAESGLEYEEIYPGIKVRNSFRATVSQLLKKVGDECSLTYDMGDSWHHTVRLVEIRRYEDKYIRFGDIVGFRAAQALPPFADGLRLILIHAAAVGHGVKFKRFSHDYCPPMME